MAAYDRFYKGDIADELVRGTQEQGGLITKDDLASWRPRLEEPVKTTYKGIEVYKLTVWTQGPAMLQALNILETDLKAMGYNSSRYIHTLYQAISMAFADRDFYYGDPTFPPEEPVAGLLSKEYAQKRWAGGGRPQRPGRAPRRSLSLPGRHEPLPGAARRVAQRPRKRHGHAGARPRGLGPRSDPADDAGTTSVIAADEEGWVVSMTPSGAWNPAVVAGRTGIGLSQRMQAFVLEPRTTPTTSSCRASSRASRSRRR